MIKTDKKAKIVAKYIALLKASKNDEQIETFINNLISYHVDKGFIENQPMVDLNGVLPILSYIYMVDRNRCLMELKTARKEERVELQAHIEALNQFLEENEQLIKKEEEIKSRQSKMRKLEKKLSWEEIDSLKKQYLQEEEENQVLKRSPSF